MKTNRVIFAAVSGRQVAAQRLCVRCGITTDRRRHKAEWLQNTRCTAIACAI
jgi:hypothetical protein